MTAEYELYLVKLEQEAAGALDSPEPWRIQESITGWDVVAVVGNKVVDVATAHTEGMAAFIANLRNSGR